MAHDVFVSYSQKDKPIADAVVARLEQDGIRCWIAPRDILPGTSWGDAIVDAIAGSKVMVLVLSGNSNRSRQVIREVERAVASDVIILPFRVELIDPTGALAYFLGTEHWLDALTPPLEHHLDRLAGAVHLLVEGVHVPSGALDRAPPSLARARRRPWIPAAVSVTIAALVVGVVVAVISRDPGGSSSPTSTIAATTSEDTTTTATALVTLEQVARYRPADLDPTDLHAPGPIQGFDIEGSWLVYANGIDGLTRMSIDDPATPRPSATLSGSFDARQVAILGDYYAVIAGEFADLRILFVKNDGSSTTALALDGAEISSLFGIEVDGDYVYVASHGYIGIIDATDPGHPHQVFAWEPPGATGNPASTFVEGGIGYFGAGWDGLYIMDLGDPSNPALLGHWPSPDWVIDVEVVGDLAYVTLGDSGVAVLDVSDPTDPRVVGTVAIAGFASPIAVAGNQAFVGYFGVGSSPGGVAVIDVTNPAAPALIGTFGSFPAITDLGVADGHVFVSDGSEGLVVLRVEGGP